MAYKIAYKRKARVVVVLKKLVGAVGFQFVLFFVFVCEHAGAGNIFSYFLKMSALV